MDRLFVYDKNFGPTLKILGGCRTPHTPLMCVPVLYPGLPGKLFSYERSKNITSAEWFSRWNGKMPGKVSPYEQALTWFWHPWRTIEVLFLKQPPILPFLYAKSATTCHIDWNKSLKLYVEAWPMQLWKRGANHSWKWRTRLIITSDYFCD